MCCIATRCNTLQHYTTIHCNTLQRITYLRGGFLTAPMRCFAILCTTLQRTATHYNTLQHTTTRWNTLKNAATHQTGRCLDVDGTDTAPHCYTLQNTTTHTTHSNTFKHVSTCNTQQHVETYVQHTATHQAGWRLGVDGTDIATYCNTLQHTAIHCNT